MSSPQVILYAYPQSPFAAKLELILTLKQIPYSYVEVERMPPRPALRLLGITYRRIPVLAIDSDLYLDTSLAVIALEERFPNSPSLKGGPGGSWGIQTATAFHWSDRALFSLAAGALPWTKMPDAFVKDRSEYRGAGPIDPKAMEAARPKVLSALRSHIDLIEKQLASRSSDETSTFLLGTDQPAYLDISLYFSLNWVAGFGTADSIFKPSSGTSSFPLTFAWMSLLKSTLESASRTAPGKTSLSSEDAARSILSRPTPSSVLKTDQEEPLLVAGWLTMGDQVDVIPTDTGKVPQKGRLVGLDREKVSIEVEAQGGKCTVHAPRLGFDVKRCQK